MVAMSWLMNEMKQTADSSDKALYIGKERSVISNETSHK